MDIAELLTPFERLLAEHYAPEKLRAMQGDDALVSEAQTAVEASGFLDVMRAESDGGAGLPLLAVEPLMRAIGAQAAPASLAVAMLERAVGSRVSQELSAVAHSVLIAGALEKLLAICVDYANMREQFGKPIGKQQSLQHQLALLAEQSALVRIASQYGCAAGLEVKAERAAVAKHTASAAVPLAASVAHAVYGAIGITAEHDLQLWVTRLYDWRDACGSESKWADVIGKARLTDGTAMSVDFVRSI